MRILNGQDVDMSGCVTIQDITKMENRVKSPIVLYALNNAVEEQFLNAGLECDESDEPADDVLDASFIDDGDGVSDESFEVGSIDDGEVAPLNYVPDNENENEAGYYVACIRAPSKQTLRKYTRPPCHLIMMTPTHLAYIPDIEDFLCMAFHD